MLFLELCYLGISLLGTLLLAIFARYNLCPDTICYKIQFVPDTVCARYNLCPIQIVPIQIVPIQFVPIQFVPDTICADTICTWTGLSKLQYFNDFCNELLLDFCCCKYLCIFSVFIYAFLCVPIFLAQLFWSLSLILM